MLDKLKEWQINCFAIIFILAIVLHSAELSQTYTRTSAVLMPNTARRAGSASAIMSTCVATALYNMDAPYGRSVLTWLATTSIP